MKKITISVLISLSIILLLLSGCAPYKSDKWDKKDPNMPSAYIEQHEKQLKDNQEKLDKDPENFEWQFEKAFQLQALGRYKQAVEEYEKALKIAPNDFATLNNLAAIYEEVEEYKKAEEYIKKLYALNPDNTETLRDTVRILLKADNPLNAQEALDNFAKTIKRNKAETAETGAVISELYQSIYDYNKKNETK